MLVLAFPSLCFECMCFRKASWRLEKCLSFMAGGFRRLEAFAWVQGVSSKASHVVSWKGLPSRFAHGKVMSARSLLALHGTERFVGGQKVVF